MKLKIANNIEIKCITGRTFWETLNYLFIRGELLLSFTLHSVFNINIICKILNDTNK